MANLTILKFALPLENAFTIPMPAGAQVLTVQMQQGIPQLWALVDSDAITEDRPFEMHATGHLIDFPPGRYVGTFQMGGGVLVYHVFEHGAFTTPPPLPPAMPSTTLLPHDE